MIARRPADDKRQSTGTPEERQQSEGFLGTYKFLPGTSALLKVKLMLGY
jgi:hypothetical protein